MDNTAPAFPVIFSVSPGNTDPFTGKKVEITTEHAFSGMSIRIYIATKALEGLIANPNSRAYDDKPKEYASAAVAYADALIAQLSK